MTRWIPAGAAAIAALSMQAGAQQPFKSGAYRVEVYATVTDGAGKIVTDLPRDRFEIYDNGRLQAISTFANDIQPITVVMMLDRSGSMVGNFERVEKAAETFVERLLPIDKARIGSFSNRIEVDPRAFTSDKPEMLNILQTELQEEGPTPLWNAVGVGMTALLHQEGRRVVLVFTDGMDNPMNGSANNLSLRQVTKRADEEDVMIYAIGLASQGYHGGGFGRGIGGRGMRGMRGITDKPDPGLEKLAGASGGGYFELTSTTNLASTFTRVVDELHHQYLLAFEPQKLDGKSHTLEVRVTGEGLIARARRSYVAARPD